MEHWLGSKEKGNWGKYLGVHILNNRSAKAKFEPMLDKIKRKLSGLNTKNWSLAGRITLAKSVICAIPYYEMQSSKLPDYVCSSIETMIRKFIWDSSNGESKTHLVNWNDLCQPLYEGGLGIQKPKSMNNAFLMKLGLKLIADSECFWVKILLGKYKCSQFNQAVIRRGQRVSRLWRAVVEIREEVQRGIKWAIRDENGVRFWRDAWRQWASYSIRP